MIKPSLSFRNRSHVTGLLIFMIMISVGPAFAQSKKAASQQTSPLREVGPLPKILKESSGIEATGPNSLWSHNDDTLPVLYNLDSTGHLVKTVYLNVKNLDWEELTQDDKHNIYIGDIGNNSNAKKNLRIFKIGNPDSIKEKVVMPEIIRFTYADQKSFPPPANKRNFDAEAMVASGENIFIFSKNRTKPFDGYTKIYRLPNVPGEYVAQLIDSIPLCKDAMMNCWVTSAALSPDKKHLALLSHDKIWLISCFKDNNFAKGHIQTIPLNHFSQKEAITFVSNTEIYITDELALDILGGSLYKMNLSPWMKQSCR